jgi:hypothetical protein
MKYEVVALYGYDPQTGACVTRNGQPTSVTVAICATVEQALAVVREKLLDVVPNVSVPPWEFPFYSIRPTTVTLVGF